MKLRRLIQQACGCFTVRGGSGRKVRTRLRCLPLHDVCKLHRSRHEALIHTSKLAPAPRCEAEADSRCVLVSASGTQAESACRPDQAPAVCFPVEPPRRDADADSRCVLVTAAGTPTRHLYTSAPKARQFG